MVVLEYSLREPPIVAIPLSAQRSVTANPTQPVCGLPYLKNVMCDSKICS